MNHQVAGKFRKLDRLNVPSQEVGVYVEPPFWKNIASIHALRQLGAVHKIRDAWGGVGG